MEQLREYNKKLLYNILPDHVAQHFLAQQAKKNDVSFIANFVYRGIMFIFCCCERCLHELETTEYHNFL